MNEFRSVCAGIAVLRAEPLASVCLFNVITSSMFSKEQDLGLALDVVGIRIISSKCDKVLVCATAFVVGARRIDDQEGKRGEELKVKQSEHPAGMELCCRVPWKLLQWNCGIWHLPVHLRPSETGPHHILVQLCAVADARRHAGRHTSAKQSFTHA